MTNQTVPIRSICVYCGSNPGRDSIYRESGVALGRAIASHGLELVYGGGTRGIMGAVAEGAKLGGGRVTGIIPEFLLNKEGDGSSSSHLDEQIVTVDMHERKHKMFERSDAFVTLPGGIGTLEEIVEIMTWGQLGRHRKPMVFANVNGFWNPMMQLVKHMADEGFIHTRHLVRPMVIDRIEDIVPAILSAGTGKGEDSLISRL